MHQLFNKICKHRKKHDTVQPHHIAVIAYKKIRQCVHTAKRNCHTSSARIFFPGIPSHRHTAKPYFDQNYSRYRLVHIHEFHKQKYQNAEWTAKIITKQAIDIIAHRMSRLRPPQTFLQLVQKFLIKSSILMDPIYHKGRTFSKWINTFQRKTGPKDHHRK